MTLKAKIERIEGDRVVVGFEDGQKLTLPKTAIEGASALGQEVVCILTVPGGEDAARSDMARSVLNELLRPGERL